MKTFRAAVVAALLAIWSFPATSLAAPLPASPPVAAQPAVPVAATDKGAAEGEAAELARREQQARDLQDFRGGGVSIYLGSGAVVVLLLIIIILLIL